MSNLDALDALIRCLKDKFYPEYNEKDGEIRTGGNYVKPIAFGKELESRVLGALGLTRVDICRFYGMDVTGSSPDIDDSETSFPYWDTLFTLYDDHHLCKAVRKGRKPKSKAGTNKVVITHTPSDNMKKETPMQILKKIELSKGKKRGVIATMKLNNGHCIAFHVNTKKTVYIVPGRKGEPDIKYAVHCSPDDHYDPFVGMCLATMRYHLANDGVGTKKNGYKRFKDELTHIIETASGKIEKVEDKQEGG